MITPSKRAILLITFLHDLKTRDRKACLFVVICIFLQVFLTSIKLQFTPFFLFGMYSEKLVATDTFSTTKVLVNGRSIEAFGLPVRERFLLETNAVFYVEMMGNNGEDPLKTRIEGRYPSIARSDLYPFFGRRIYNTQMARDRFKRWFKKKSLKIAKIDNGIVQIVKTTFVLNRTTLYLKPTKHEILEVF